MLVHSAFVHAGAARAAVHALKYRGIEALADPLAALMVPLLADDAAALVPVPRAISRRLRYRVDPGRALAAALSARTGLPVVASLRAPLVRSSQVRHRRQPSFAAARPVPLGAVVVDDVVTTGATLVAATQACGATSAVTVTRALFRQVGKQPHLRPGV